MSGSEGGLPDGEVHHSAACAPQNVSAPGSVEEVREALKDGPRGALAIASVALASLVAGWLAFYFLLFLPRGGIR